MDLFYMDIVQVLQEKVDEIAKEKWKNDDCPPSFAVSILYEDKDVHKLLLTIKHSGSTFSRVIFPQPKMKYGYESLEYEMTQLYNQTM